MVYPKLPQVSKTTLSYHAQFDYPLTSEEISYWRANFTDNTKIPGIKKKTVNGKVYYFTSTAQSIARRLQREKYSKKKLTIAHKAGRILAYFPSIKFVGVTGSLAMHNADKEADIDLMLICAHRSLWTTRALALITLVLCGFKLRRSGDKNEKDKLCLNLWFDENYLAWTNRNPHSAHEIAQIIPLVNKQFSYEKFLYNNKWVQDYWPNAVQIKKVNAENKFQPFSLLISLIEPMLYWLQFMYMKKKITKEVVSIDRAQFHPHPH